MIGEFAFRHIGYATRHLLNHSSRKRATRLRQNVLFACAMALCVTFSAHSAAAANAGNGWTQLRGHDARLLRVGDAVLRAAAPLCAGRTTAGVSVANLDDVPPAGHADAMRAYGNAERRIFVSASTHPQIAVGTGILAIDGQPVAGLDTLRIWTLLSAAPIHTPMVLDTDAGRIAYAPQAGCPAIFVVDTARGVSAGSDGTRIRVTTQMLDFAADDAELAAIIAHEVAHLALCHHDRDDPLRPRSKRKREAEADRLSARLLIAAGYDLSGARSFWPRFGKQRGLTDLFDFSHGTAKGRLRRITAEYDAAHREELSADDPAPFAPFAGRGACHVLPERAG